MARPALTLPRRARGLTLALAVVLGACSGVLGACSGARHRPPAPPPSSPPGLPIHPRGGSARVAVWEEPDPAAPTLSGAAVRALVLPQLWVAGPDGRWQPSLVAPGSDAEASDRRSATFRLRTAASWSDGSPITVDDLRRSADHRFVAGVDDPAPDGTVTVRFTQPLPGWRRLWSGLDSVAGPRPSVWGGPFTVVARTPGLETVLRRNDHWYGSGPWLDEVHLVLVPSVVTARQLLGRGTLDVVEPLAFTARTPQLSAVPAVPGVSVLRASGGGWWVGVLTNPNRLAPDGRAALLGTVAREAFVDTLLSGEAGVLNGFSGGGDQAWAGAGAGSPSASAAALARAGPIDFVGMAEEPMLGLLQRSMQKRARASGGTLAFRNAEADRVEGWVATGDYAAAVVDGYDSPDVCWTCRWASVDAASAVAADAGGPGAVGRLEAELRSRALVLPLWAPVVVVAVRQGLQGVVANGWGLNGAWDAADWWRL